MTLHESGEFVKSVPRCSCGGEVKKINNHCYFSVQFFWVCEKCKKTYKLTELTEKEIANIKGKCNHCENYVFSYDLCNLTENEDCSFKKRQGEKNEISEEIS